MANLTPAETPAMDAVYQLEITDPAQGGVAGVMNRQAQALLNRTAYLKGVADAHAAALLLKAPSTIPTAGLPITGSDAHIYTLKVIGGVLTLVY